MLRCLSKKLMLPLLLQFGEFEISRMSLSKIWTGTVQHLHALGDFLSDLVRRPSVDHVQFSPSILGLSTRGCADKEVVFELSLEAILFYVVGEGSRDHSSRLLVQVLVSPQLYILGIPYAGEARPAHICSIGEKVDEVLRLGKLLQKGRLADTTLEKSGG